MPTPAPSATAPSRPSGRVVRWIARLRVRHWAHFLVLPLAAFSPSSVEDPLAALALVRGVAIAGSILAFGYLLNGITDRALDRDPSKNPLVGEPASPAHLQAVVVLAGIALALALTGPPVVVAATLTTLIAGWAYSAGPRLKRFPLIGTVLNAACFAPLLFVGTRGATTPDAPLLALAFTALLLENQILHEGEDAAEDRDAGILTTYAILGPRGAAAVMGLFGLGVAAAVHLLGGDGWLSALTACVFGLGFPIACASSRGASARLRRVRAAHRLAGVIAGGVVYALARA